MREKMVIVNLSNRHVHLDEADLMTLFGRDAKLTKLKDLQQPGQFAANECVTIKCSKGAIENVRILGPTRKDTQCEIMASDVFKLGAKNCPVRESGKVENSAEFEIIGPVGRVEKSQGLIIAQRHIHFDIDSAKKFEVVDKEIVSLRVGKERSTIFENVVCRVSASYSLECHLDFDEGNAASISNGSFGEVIKK